VYCHHVVSAFHVSCEAFTACLQQTTKLSKAHNTDTNTPNHFLLMSKISLTTAGIITHTLVDGTSMTEECVAVDAVGSMPKLQPRVDRQVCTVRFLT